MTKRSPTAAVSSFRSYQQTADEDGSRNKPVLQAIDSLKAVQLQQVEALKRIAAALDIVAQAMHDSGFVLPKETDA